MKKEDLIYLEDIRDAIVNNEIYGNFKLKLAIVIPGFRKS